MSTFIVFCLIVISIYLVHKYNNDPFSGTALTLKKILTKIAQKKAGQSLANSDLNSYISQYGKIFKYNVGQPFFKTFFDPFIDTLQKSSYHGNIDLLKDEILEIHYKTNQIIRRVRDHHLDKKEMKEMKFVLKDAGNKIDKTMLRVLN